MRQNDARKWLHAGLDLLPVLLIPVFMIYSHRHVLTERTEVDIQYKYQSNEVNSVDDLIVGNIYFIDDLYFKDTVLEAQTYNIEILKYDSLDVQNLSDFYMDDYSINSFSGFNILMLEYDPVDRLGYFDFTDTDFYIDIALENVYLDFSNLVFVYNASFYNVFVANNLLPQYTDYNVIESVDVHDETSSVMNVFMDDFNVAIDKYFNMGNVFNLTGVYQWFNTNIFGGNAPTIIYSVWNIALYELVMDLLFLLYGLFMWFIDMCKHLMEKPFRSIK